MQGSYLVAGVLMLGIVIAGCGEEDCAVTDSCPNQAPEVIISSPDDGDASTIGESVTFSGTATDPEDGAITGEALVWTSDLDGLLGTGTMFSRSDLSGGFHEITLTATDSEGRVGTATITFGVGGAPLVQIEAPTEQSGGEPASIESGGSVTFTGSALDVEDGPLSGASLTWTSNVDGQIGTGESFSTTGLSDGMHTVTLTAIDSDGNEAKETLLLIVKPPAQPGFQIHIRWSEGVELTAPQRSAVTEAVEKIEGVITGDVPDIPVTDFQDVGTCGGATIPKMRESVDDVIIYLEFVAIDGPGSTVASAGPCFTRSTPENELTAFSLVGGMRFDTADLALLNDQGLMADVIAHEMLHVLGFGIFWENVVTSPGGDPVDYLEQPSDPAHPEYDETMVDTHFTGPEATARFLEVGGGAYVGGEIVPVENDEAEFSIGSLDGHWREEVFDTELMSTSLNAGSNPLSVVTVGQFEDLGYEVDYDAADPYVQTFAILAPHAQAGPSIDLSNDVWRGPLHAVDASGSARRVE